jgi:glycosyltransferase involved in cell wall biosynthesis
VIYNRAYVEQFDVAGAAHKRVASPLTILTVGRFVRAKYQECLIRAVHQLDAKLVLIGNGELRPSLERLVTTLQMADRVTFHSRVPHGEIALQYSAADIFAIATHYEGFCIPVLEAMAAGLPIVASRIPSIEEILGDAGVLVENEPAAFAAALRRLIADPGLRHEYGGRARRRASMMDGSVMEAREAALYETLCASAGARP